MGEGGNYCHMEAPKTCSCGHDERLWAIGKGGELTTAQARHRKL